MHSKPYEDSLTLRNGCQKDVNGTRLPQELYAVTHLGMSSTAIGSRAKMRRKLIRQERFEGFICHVSSNWLIAHMQQPQYVSP